MSTDRPLLPRQLLDQAEWHLAAGRDEDAARALTQFAAHTLRVAQEMRRQSRSRPAQAGNLDAIYEPDRAYPLRVEVRSTDEEQAADPVPRLVRHTVGVVLGLVEPAVSRAAAGDHLDYMLPLAADRSWGGIPGYDRVVPDVGTVLAQMRLLWWEQLTGFDLVAVRVHDLCHHQVPLPVEEVLAVCRLGREQFVADVELGESSTYTLGSVEPGEGGVWLARVGDAGHGPVVGEYGSISAAHAAVEDAIAVYRRDLQDQLRAKPTPLARFTMHPWAGPTVTVMASRAQLDADDPQLVTTGQIAHRARVGVRMAEIWAGQPSFPAPAGQRRAWEWPQVDQWLTATGNVPHRGYAPDRPAVSDNPRS